MKMLSRHTLHRRYRTLLSLACAAGMMLTTEMASARTFVYVANADDATISRYSLDEQAGTLQALGNTQAASKVMPMALSPDQSHLYASIRSAPFRVISYRLDPQSGDLQQQGETPLPNSMANIDTDRSGRYLLAASYGDHLVSVSPIAADGLVSPVQQVVPTGHNAHAIHASPDNRYVISSSLGDDQLMQFRFDQQTGTLSANTPAFVKTAEGTGPRHFLFSADGRYCYVLGELSGTVTTYGYDASTGQLDVKGTTAGVPAGELGLVNGLPPTQKPTDGQARVWAADMHLSKDGQYLYVSERTRSIISVLHISPDTGLPEYQGRIQVEQQPRGFALTADGQFMVVAGEKDAHIGLYRLDQQSGMPTRIGEAATGKGANWVTIVSLPEHS